jgi:hypothetical protein
MNRDGATSILERIKMNRKIKVVGLCVFALFAMSAVAAAGAQAANFHSESTTTFYTGEQFGTNTFTTTAGTVKCKKAKFTGEATGTSLTTIQVTPEYLECTAFGQAATVTTTGCVYTLSADGTIVELDGCTTPVNGGDGIVINVPAGNCKVTVANQTFGATGGTAVNSITYTNEGSGSTRDVKVNADVTNDITTTVDGPGTICGALTTTVDNSYVGSVTTLGYSNSAHTVRTGIWVE